MIATTNSIYEKHAANFKTANKNALWEKYMAYAASKNSERIVWYMGVIIWMPCLFMVVSIIAMALLTPNYIWFVGLSMLLFFANVIVHIAEAESKIFVPLFHATLFVLTIVPIVTYFILG